MFLRLDVVTPLVHCAPSHRNQNICYSCYFRAWKVIQCYTVLYSVIQCYTVLYSVVQCYTVLYSVIQCYTYHIDIQFY